VTRPSGNDVILYEKDLELEKPDPVPLRQDAFGDEEHAEVKYKVLEWWYVPLLVGVLWLVCLQIRDTGKVGCSW